MRWGRGGGEDDVVEERQAISMCPLKLVLWLFSVRSLSRDTQGIWLWKASALSQSWGWVQASSLQSLCIEYTAHNITCDIQASSSTEGLTCETRHGNMNIYNAGFGYSQNLLYFTVFCTSSPSWVQVQDKKTVVWNLQAPKKCIDAKLWRTRASSCKVNNVLFSRFAVEMLKEFT